MALFSTVFPSFFMMYGVKKLGASKSAIFNNIGPFITLYLGYLILNESITFSDIIGALLVIVGVFSLRRFNK